jgi:hypothetical protein
MILFAAFLAFIALTDIALGLTLNGHARFTRQSHYSCRVRQRTCLVPSLPSDERVLCLFASNSGGNRLNDGGKTLSTKQVLDPEIFLSQDSPLAPVDEPVPLFAGLRLLTRSLESIIDAATTSQESTLLDHLDATTILRIEQPISAVHSIDPLCWIHAQQRGINNLRREFQTSANPTIIGDKTLPVIYFRDSEGQVEAVALGKTSPSYSESWDPFEGKRIWDKTNGNVVNGDVAFDKMPRMFKESELPPGSRVYGGSRFDWQYYHEKMDSGSDGKNGKDDWDGFGGNKGGYWILPAVELRREILEVHTAGVESDEINDDQRKKTIGTKVVTLAIHLHNISPSSRTHQNQAQHKHHRKGWRDAASHIMVILRELTDQLSPAVSCTTLPPVVTRSESTGNEDDGSDSGLAFERGVAEALRQIQSYGNSDGKSLRKVVLARKVDLNFGSSVGGLDILMRMKYGGHIGHLFYLNPGCDGVNTFSGIGEGPIRSREFFGCTPERLFRVNSGHDRMVTTEALAGTRVRGLTPSADNELLRELLSSKKDMLENDITGHFINEALLELQENGWLEKGNDLLKSYDYNGNTNQIGDNTGPQQRYFVRRLRHLQHICQTFEGKLSSSASVIGESYDGIKF